MQLQSRRLNRADRFRANLDRFADLTGGILTAAMLVLFPLAVLHTCTCTTPAPARAADGISISPTATPASAPATLTLAPSEWAAEQAAQEAAYNALWETDPYGAAKAATVYEPAP